MINNKKIRVAVLYGGRSGEHEVSLLSAANVIQYLDRSKFEVVPIGIDKKGVWFLGNDIKKELQAAESLELLRSPERMLFNPDALGKQTGLAIHPQRTGHLERLFDVVFPAIHGSYCEDGTIQGFLELTDLPYVGCGVLASAIGMDKDVSKRLVRAAGIEVPPYCVVKKAQWNKDRSAICASILSNLPLPFFVKPSNTGSSVGITKVKTPKELEAAITFAFRYDSKVLVEKGIEATELEVAVLQSLDTNAENIVSVVGEIRPNHEFYSYEAKYLDENGALLCIPAAISGELQEKAQQIALKIFKVLECESMARVDLFLEKSTNKIYFNEINTIPGFTAISMYPKMMAASGISYPELLTRLVYLAIDRHQIKSNLCRDYSNTPSLEKMA